MALVYRYRPTAQEEMVSPKQREMLAKRKEELISEINGRLDQMPDSEIKQELIRKRDHCISKFPKFPVDLSIWTVAYFDDWMRDFHRAMEAP